MADEQFKKRIDYAWSGKRRIKGFCLSLIKEGFWRLLGLIDIYIYADTGVKKEQEEIIKKDCELIACKFFLQKNRESKKEKKKKKYGSSGVE